MTAIGNSLIIFPALTVITRLLFSCSVRYLKPHLSNRQNFQKYEKKIWKKKDGYSTILLSMIVLNRWGSSCTMSLKLLMAWRSWWRDKEIFEAEYVWLFLCFFYKIGIFYLQGSASKLDFITSLPKLLYLSESNERYKLQTHLKDCYEVTLRVAIFALRLFFNEFSLILFIWF